MGGTAPLPSVECMTAEPTIVLVHGAFTDAASWAPVTRRLLDLNYVVRAPSLPGRGLADDAAYLREFAEQLETPVLLVGHSYGGAVITVAGDARTVVGLVYISGFALEEGESIGRLQGDFPDTELASNLVYSRVPSGGSEPGMDVSVAIDSFPEVLAAEVPLAVAEVMAVSQRPLAATVFGEPARVAAWRKLPSWGVVASADRAVSPDLTRFAYARAGVREVVEIDAPHLVMQARPDEVVAVLSRAATAVR